ncbi:MAG: EF-hand domain-containing protein [Planctomycetota bacterium]
MKVASLAIILTLTFSAPNFAQQTDKNPQDKINNSEAGLTGKNRRLKRRGRGQQRQPNLQSIFNRMDSNQDGVLTPDEVPQRMAQRLRNVDKDESGSISMKELSAAFQSQFQNQNGFGGMKRGMRESGMSGKKNRQSQLSPEETVQFMINRMDKDGNGEITADEVPDRMKNNFAKLDKNGNDVLDKNEIVAMIEIKKAEGGKKSNRYDTNREATKAQMPKRPPRSGSAK